MTLDDFARVVTLVGSGAIIVYSALLIIKYPRGWRSVVPVLVWAISMFVFSVARIVLYPRPAVLLNWMSLLVHFLAGLAFVLLLYYYHASNGRNGNGGNEHGIIDGRAHRDRDHAVYRDDTSHEESGEDFGEGG